LQIFAIKVSFYQEKSLNFLVETLLVEASRMRTQQWSIEQWLSSIFGDDDLDDYGWKKE